MSFRKKDSKTKNERNQCVGKPTLKAKRKRVV